MMAILFLKKNFEQSFFQILRGQKSKIGCFYEFIPGFPKGLGRIVFEHKNGVTIMWSVESVGLPNLPSLKFQKK